MSSRLVLLQSLELLEAKLSDNNDDDDETYVEEISAGLGEGGRAAVAALLLD